MSCLERVARFIEGSMQADEVITFVAHVQECFDCREFLGALPRYLDAREQIQEKLDRKGG